MLFRSVQRATITSLKEIVSIAPFLSTEAVDSLVMNSDPDCDMNGILSLAPFMSRDALNSLALEKIHVNSLINKAHRTGSFLVKGDSGYLNRKG